MYPLDSYPAIQKGLRKEVEHERLKRAARLWRLGQLSALRGFVAWAGNHLTRWGQKGEDVCIARKTLNRVPASPHH